MSLELNYKATKAKLVKATERIEYLENEVSDLRRDVEYWQNCNDAKINLIARLTREVDEIHAARSFLRDKNRLLAENHKLTAERDAALAEVKTLSKNIGEFADRTTKEIRGLRSALREAKEALLGVLDNQERGAEYWSVSGGVYEAVECNNAIKSINKVLGEE